jgi:hypothetical protein
LFGSNTILVVVAVALTCRAARAATAAKLAAEIVYVILNAQRSIMLRALHGLATRIAFENPSDANAQLAAEKAERDLEDAERA